MTAALLDTTRKYPLFFIIGFITVAVLSLGLWNLETNPGFWFDEGVAAGPARNLAEHGVYGTQIAPGEFQADNYWISIGWPVVLPTALFIKLFGAGIWQARITPLIYLIAFVLAVFFFIRKLFDSRTAFWSVLLLLTFNPLYGNGKALLGETPALFWLLFGGLTFLYFQERSEKKFLYWTALFWGLAISAKLTFVLFGPALIFLLFVLWLRQKKINFKTLIIFLVIFSIPLWIWLYFAFDFSFFRAGDSPFTYYFNTYAQESFGPLVLQNLLRFFTESTPIHFALLFLSSLIIFWLKRKEINAKIPLLVVFGIFSSLFLVWYLKTPGWYRYFYPVHLLTLIFFPAALILFRRKIVYFILVALVVFQAGHLMANFNDLKATDVLAVRDYFDEQVPQGSSIFVASRPEIAYVLNRDNLSQFIFINKNLVVGDLATDNINSEYLIAGRDDLFVIENQDFLSFAFLLEKEIGHYKIYKKQ